MRSDLKCLIAIASVASALALAWVTVPSADASAPTPNATAPAKAQIAIAGTAHVLDGDTIEISGTRIRLEGIDAPEGGQRCNRRMFGEWSCGTAATYALIGLVQNRDVGCEDRGLDKYGRMLGICFVDGRDVNAEMVRMGLAWAYVKYSTAYVAEEAEARAAKRGVWVAATMPPWDFRALQKGQGVAQTAQIPLAETGARQRAAECTIKGNVTRVGRIYPLPTSPWYDRIVMDNAKGRRWFCSEGEAIAAGWRPAWRM